ncbi:hypothetical protein D6817_00170 [Candidatus Pacearchaeota archaeon]|nr:MAG: hypothetical protein D6817_00170 [Candidatus Pacearchaeota archaeon]
MSGGALVGIHAFLGELGIAAFIWVFVEMLKPTRRRLKRAQIAASLGIACFLLSWIFGGIFYVNTYTPHEKPLVKAGPKPWAHSIVMETKEHVFLLLPLLSFFALMLLKKGEAHVDGKRKDELRRAVLLISVVIVLLAGLIALSGYIISDAVRSALEAGVRA